MLICKPKVGIEFVMVRCEMWQSVHTCINYKNEFNLCITVNEGFYMSTDSDIFGVEDDLVLAVMRAGLGHR